MNFDVSKHTILRVVHGSRAYGLATPESDLDLKGVAIPPREYFLGFANKFEQQELLERNGNKCDSTIYEIRKFFNLASQTNPNILEILWVDESDIIFENELGATLRANKELFLSKKAKFTFAGYAHAQLKRIKTHRKYILNPPVAQPRREDFGLPKSNQIDVSLLNALNEKQAEFSSEMMTLLRKENEYNQAKNEWSQYQTWIHTRNEKRAALERKYHYDTKHASHLVRLLRMAEEILEGKGVIVKRPDAEELLAIKTRGIWSYDQLIDWANKQNSKIEKLYEITTLPYSCDMNKLDKLCIELVEKALKEHLRF